MRWPFRWTLALARAGVSNRRPDDSKAINSNGVDQTFDILVVDVRVLQILARYENTSGYETISGYIHSQRRR